MKIALNAPVWLRVPPERYGGTELVVALLADELASRGHDVTLYASGNSQTKARLESVYPHPPQAPIGSSLPDIYHSSQVYLEAEKYDIVHDHTGACGWILSNFTEVPVLATLHGEMDALSREFFENFSFPGNLRFNAISRCQQSHYLTSLPFVPVVYNAIDPQKYAFDREKGDFFIQVGRISQQKGNHLAIEAARKTGNRLVLTGKVDPSDRAYYQEMVEPHIDGEQIVFLGEVSHEEKADLLSRAKAFLFPIQWEEPFGLVMIEAMASGTPVIAMARGAAPEIVEDGKTGYLARDINEFIEAIGYLEEIDFAECRKRVVERFSPGRMADDYLKRYERLLR